MVKDIMYSNLCCYGGLYKGITCNPIKIRVDVHREVVTPETFNHSCITDHVWENGNRLYQWKNLQ